MAFYPPKMLASENADLFMPIYNRLMRKNQQFSSVICGRPGCGKSELALSLAELFNPNFKPRESVFFTAQALTDKVEGTLHKADILCLDDAGLSLHSSEALRKEVRAISKTLQSIRHKNLVVILTIPSLALLAKSTRILSDYYFEPQRIDYAKQACITKFQRLSFSPISGKMYRSNFLRFREKEHWKGGKYIEKQKVLAISVPRASMDIVHEYEQLKKERMQAFDSANAQSLREEKKDKRLTAPQIAARVKVKRDDFIVGGRLSSELIAGKFNIGLSTARIVVRLCDSPS